MSTTPLPPGMRGGAQFSGELPCLSSYRHGLFRFWGYQDWAQVPTSEKLVIIGHNPSRASVEYNDPTIAKVCRIAKAQGYSGVIMHNLMDRIGTKPQDLLSVKQVRSPENTARVIASCWNAGKVIAAWGIVHPTLIPFRNSLLDALKAEHIELHCFRHLKDGEPQHPLYLPDASRIIPWRPDKYVRRKGAGR